MKPIDFEERNMTLVHPEHQLLEGAHEAYRREDTRAVQGE